MKIATGHEIGLKIVRALTPACERIAIAGSIRRAKPNPKDIEVVYIPAMEEEQINLIERGLVPATEKAIAMMIATGYWQLDQKTKRNGPKHKRLVIPLRSLWYPANDPQDTDIVVELFRADESNWGYIYALRTGPAEFNHVLVRKPWHGGACPPEIALRDGSVWLDGAPVPVPEESDFFNVMGVPNWPPHERSAAKLGKWLLENKKRG